MASPRLNETDEGRALLRRVETLEIKAKQASCDHARECAVREVYRASEDEERSFAYVCAWCGAEWVITLETIPQVVKDIVFEGIPLGSEFRVGHRGVVIEHEKGEKFSYHVQRRNSEEQWFQARELKLIKKK